MGHASVSIVHRNGNIETRAASDSLVGRLDDLQYQLGEGPCLQAIHQDGVVRVEHARDEQRWPAFIAKAVEEGLRSQLGLRLYTDGDTLGGLNLYSTTDDEIDDEVEHLAELFAHHAVIAIDRAKVEGNLATALATRKTIGQALGILMERHEIDEDQAFAYLIRVSSHSNVKLRDVADEIVLQRNIQAQTHQPPPGS
jgi:GAF domain-containing protein